MREHTRDRTSGTRRRRALKIPVQRVDSFQQHHRSLGVAVAVFRKFAEDRSANLASMLAFWAFFSIFPLLLVLVTLLGFLLPVSMKDQVLSNVATMLPLLDPATVQGLSGEWWALGLGAVTALWSGLRVVRVAQAALNSVWGLPFTRHPTIVQQTVRGLAVLATIGVGLVVSTLVNGFVSGAAEGIDLGWVGRVLGYAIAIVLDLGLFVAAFRLLTHRQVTTRDVLPGAALCGVLFFVLQTASSLIISRFLHTAQSTYGPFATVITMLWWFYLQSVITLLGAQLNVVLKERLHPRALVDAPQTDADRRARSTDAQVRTHHDENGKRR
ncbi:YihY/virulence factor BrkB family protein [Saccharopolyspora sp. WRP15-2]|uniref:YihY/virulence factor BrkB family protein n=1 Tax=Saccharopolyspora oryzae TaxID=2997343 RepID=A0ABT4USQ2_9PSEU|nr:YihY/virulence factor BrkB family protein [Saccharopolyspora oryzae]MDA3624749.1 YihY/virulence factor BrkB family protein [Saccharopolyspora oryzae]